MLDVALNKRHKQRVFADTIDTEGIEMATLVRAEASASLTCTLIIPQWVKGKVETPHSRFSTLLEFRHISPRCLCNRTVYTQDEKNIE